MVNEEPLTRRFFTIHMTEDLTPFFEDFGTPVNGVNCIFEESDDPMSVGFDGVISAGPKLFYPTGSLTLTVGQAVTVKGRSFKVRTEPRRIEDGAITQVELV